MFKIDYEENMSMNIGDSLDFAISLCETDVEKVSFIIFDKNTKKYLFEYDSKSRRENYHLFEIKQGEISLDLGEYFYTIFVKLTNGYTWNLFSARDFKIIGGIN